MGELTNAAYQEAVKKLRALRTKQHQDDLRELMKTQWGRRIAYWLVFDLGGITKTERAAKGSALLRNEGRRVMADDIHKQLMTADPGACLGLLAEQASARQADLALLQQAKAAFKEDDR